MLFIGRFIILCCVLLFKVVVAASDVGDKCPPTKNISIGTCKLLTDCKVALRSVETKYFHPFNRCGFSGTTEIVCCPSIEQDNFGIEDRVADRECEKIKDTTLPSFGVNIVGGVSATLGEFPHMVILGYNLSGDYEFLCGGSLISNSYVLTAAHCVNLLNGRNPEIARMGVVDLGDGNLNSDTDVRIEMIIKHPNHTSLFKYNDIALLKLEKPVVYSATLSPICLYTKDVNPSISLLITGWGRISTLKNIRTSDLQKATVTAVSKSECKKSYTPWWRMPLGISNEQICAGDPFGVRDACQGDSGGPLQGWTSNDGYLRLVGLTSFGRGCGSSVPGVYTRVSSYLDWIESVVWPDSK